MERGYGIKYILMMRLESHKLKILYAKDILLWF